MVHLEHVIHKGEKRIKLVFGHNIQISDLVKTIPGRKWSKTMNSWHIPFDADYQKILQPFLISKRDKVEVKRKVGMDNMYLKVYSETMQLKRLSRSTQSIYSEFFVEFFDKFEHENISEFTFAQIYNYIRNRAQSLGFTRRKQMIAALKFYYEKVLGRDKMYFNLGKDIKVINIPVFISLQEIRPILERINSPHDKLLLFLAYHLNLSPREISDLKPSSMNSPGIITKAQKGTQSYLYLEKIWNTHVQNLKPIEYLFEVKGTPLDTCRSYWDILT